LQDKSIFNEMQTKKEKIKGRFDIKLNHRLPMQVKIEQLGTDSIAFYMHKNRQFIKKLEDHVRDGEEKLHREE